MDIVNQSLFSDDFANIFWLLFLVYILNENLLKIKPNKHIRLYYICWIILLTVNACFFIASINLKKWPISISYSDFKILLHFFVAWIQMILFYVLLIRKLRVVNKKDLESL